MIGLSISIKYGNYHYPLPYFDVEASVSESGIDIATFEQSKSISPNTCMERPIEEKVLNRNYV